MAITAKIHFLYTNIGRGHPFYLDGVIDALIRKGDIRLVRRETDVFTLSSFLPRQAWNMARWLYVKGSSGKLTGFIYKQLRQSSDYNRDGLFLRLMGTGIRARLFDDTDPVIVAHPTLVGILRGRPGVLYQHGELATPTEALVRGAEAVFVPTRKAAESFYKIGYRREDVVVTGLCVEPALVRQAGDCFRARLERFMHAGPMTGAFFSSGAEPEQHVRKIVAAVESSTSRNGRAIIFAQAGGALEMAVKRRFARNDTPIIVIDSTDTIPAETPPVLLVLFKSRREENILTAQLFPRFDYFVAPAHERSNWALGLGLPLFTLGPAIGPFASLNRVNLLEQGVTLELGSIHNARTFGATLRRLHSEGRLRKMAQAGWGKYPIQGFDVIATWLTERYGQGKDAAA